VVDWLVVNYHRYPNDMELPSRERWMDEPLMLEWIEKIWKPEVKDKQQTYIILDKCCTYLTKLICNAFAACQTEIEFIPGGYTSKLQPLDVGINKPFKNNFRAQFHDWLVTNRNNCPSWQNVAWWVSGAWNATSTSIVCISFSGARLIATGTITETELIMKMRCFQSKTAAYLLCWILLE
jgi:DDE superfamily endonuclease